MNPELFKVLADPMRYKIIQLLMEGDTCACTLIDKLPISQPTLSYHLKLLVDSGLATATREKNKIHHTINKDVLDAMIASLTHLKHTEALACQV